LQPLAAVEDRGLVLVGVLAQQRELVAAEPGDRIRWPHLGPQPPRDLDQQLVANRVAAALSSAMTTCSGSRGPM